jgi:hypothetical protein
LVSLACKSPTAVLGIACRVLVDTAFNMAATYDIAANNAE